MSGDAAPDWRQELLDDDGRLRQQHASRGRMIARMDDCLIATQDGKPLPVRALRGLPPWRAVMLARVDAKAGGAGPERGTLEQLEAEARAVGGDGVLGEWWERET